MICGKTLPVSFKYDSVLKCVMSKFVFSMSCVHIVSVGFKGGIDDLSWVNMSDLRVFHQFLLIILWLVFNLLARLSK